LIPYKPYVCKKHVESILGTRENMTKKVFNLNNMIPHSVHLVDPMQILSRQNQLLMMMLNKMVYPKILFKAYKTKLSMMIVRRKKQMKQLILVVMLIKIVMIKLMEKLPSLIWVRIYLFKVVLK
jgi:hypothetical protein